MSTTVGQLTVELKNDSRAYKRDLVKTTTQAGDEGGKAASRSFAKRFGDGIKQHSKLIAASAGAALGTFAAASAQAFASFEKGMNEVFTLLPGITEPAMAEMSQQVKDFANEFGVVPDEVIPALYQSLSAGIPQDNVFAFLETANKAAKAGVATTEEAVGLLSQSVNAWGLETAEAERVSDAMFTTVRLGVTNFPLLSQHMNKVSSSASVLGISIEEVGAATAALTKQGQPTEIALTNLAATMTLLQKGTPELNRVLKHMGYESGQAALDALGLQGTLEMLRTGADDLGVAIPKMTGRVQAANAIFGLTGEKAAVANEVLAEFETTTGATEEAFQRMDQGVQATADRIAARIQTLMIDVGSFIEPVAPLLVAFGPTIGRALGGMFGAGFGLLAEAVPRLMKPVIAKIIAVTGAARLGGALTTMLGAGMTAASGGIERLGGLMGGKFGTAFKVAGIAAVALLWVEVWNQWNAFNDKVQAAQADLQEKVDSATTQTGNEAIGNLQNLVTTMQDLQGLDRILADTWGGAQQVEGLRNLATAIANDSTLTAEEIEAAGRLLAEASHEAASRGNQAIADEIDALAETVAAKAPVAAEAVEGYVDYAVRHGAEAAASGDAIEEAATDIADTMADATGDALEDDLTNVMDRTFEEMALAWARATPDLRENIENELKDAVRSGTEAVRSGSSIEDAFADLGDDAVSALMGAIHGGMDINEAFADLPFAMRQALTPMVGQIEKAMRVANKTAAHEAALLGPSIRGGIRDGKDAVDQAMADLRWAITHPLRNMKHIAAIEGQLTGKQLRQGLKSQNPDIRRQAEQTRAILIDEWEKATGQSWDHGKSVSNNLAGGVKARRKEVRRQARLNRQAVNEQHEGAATDATADGEATTKNFAQGLRNFIGNVIAAAQAVAQAVADNTEPGSPTKEGPLSETGGTEGWGKRLAEQFAEGLSSAKFDPVSALGLQAFDGVAAASRGTTGRSAQRASGAAGGGGTNINLKTYGLPMRARTPAEVATQLRRAARLGVISTERPGRFKER